MIDLLLRSLVLIVAVWLAAEVVGRAGGSAAMRHLAWLLGFGGLAILPLLAALVPDLPLPILPAVADSALSAPLTSAGPAPVFQPVEPAISIFVLAELAYLAIAAVLLVRPLAGRFLLSRMWRSARPVDDAGVLGLLDRLSRSLELRRRVDLRITTAPTVPITWGMLRPRILVPADARGWTQDQWRVVLLHELGHVSRHDSSGRLAAAVLCGLYWANPLVWLAAERMRREQEHACDDLVLASGAEAAAYARNLLGAARTLHTCGNQLGFASAMVRQTDLERRLVAIVGDLPRTQPGGVFAAGGSLVALGVATLVAVIVPVAATIATPSARQAISNTTPATDPSPPATVAAPAARKSRMRPVDAPPATLVGAVAAATTDSAGDYQRAMARYRQERADYEIAVAEYRGKLAGYHRERDQYRRDLADHRRVVEAARALPEGSPGKLIPPAPLAPLAPVAPVPPLVPPLPPPNHN